MFTSPDPFRDVVELSIDVVSLVEPPQSRVPFTQALSTGLGASLELNTAQPTSLTVRILSVSRTGLDPRLTGSSA